MRSKEKIKDLNAVAAIVSEARAGGRTVVHCHGTFDPLHIGHIRHFEQAKAMGDVLIVTVTPDRFVNKGPQRPVFTEALRAEAIAALSCVDYVAVNDTPMAVETIRQIKPDIFVKGSEYAAREKDRTGAITLEEDAVREAGGRLAFTYDLTFSASTLVNRHLQVHPPGVSEFLAEFSRRHTAEEVISYLENARPLRTLVIGEAIVDEYQYCEAIGKSSKEPTLAVRQLEAQRYAGGILAVGSHAASFCDDVGLVTILGDNPSHEDFIRERLPPNVAATFIRRAGAPTVLKRRFVESYFFTKMLEVYEIDDAALAADVNENLCATLERTVADYDVVVVADFGHSMMTDEAVDVVTRKANFLALNVQSNAGNLGYHTLSRYPRADYVSVNESEIRIEARNRRGDLKKMVRGVSDQLGAGKITVTRGKRGCLGFDREAGFCEVPTFATQVVDRVGAGDAVLAVTALCAAQDAPMDVVAFIGNAVGAQAVGTVGNERAVARVPLFRQIESLLK